MSILTAKQETFAQLVARGKPPADAYAAAGYSTRRPGWRGAAGQLVKQEAVADRIEVLTGQYNARLAKATAMAQERLALSKEAMGRELLPIVGSNIADFLEIDASGRFQFAFDLSRASYEKMKAIRSIQIETVVRGKGDEARVVEKVRLQLYEKTPATLALARLFGMIVETPRDPPPLPYEIRLRQMSPEQRAEEGRKLVEAARARLLEDRLSSTAGFGTTRDDIEMQPDGQGGYEDAGEE